MECYKTKMDQHCVLVTGASGFLGSHLVENLVQKNYFVTGLFRRANLPPILLKLPRNNLQLCKIDITNSRADLSTLLQHHHSVIHVAAKAGDWDLNNAFHKINVDATRNILEESVKSGFVKNFIYVSSLAVHGFGNHVDTTEEGPYYPLINPYQTTKAKAEKSVLSFNSSALKTTALRPGNIYGPGDTTTFFPIFDALKNGLMGYLGNGHTLTSVVFVEDVIDAIILALESDKSHGEVFNIVGNDIITWKNLLELSAKLLKVPAPRVRLPKSVASSAAFLLNILFRSLKIMSAPPITRYRVDQLTNNYHFNSRKAKEILGFEARYSISSGLPITVADYLSRLQRTD